MKRGAYDAGLCAEFQKRFVAGGTVKEIALEMKIPSTTAYRWAVAVRMAAAEWLRREGWDEGKLIRMWIAQAKRSRGHVHNGALREIGSILDVYPAKKEPAPPAGPVTVIFNTNLEMYDKEIEANAAREITIRSGVQNESQGDAGRGTSAQGQLGSGLLDPTKGNGRKKQ